MLQLTLKDGSTVTFPFGEDSSLSVWTPDGVNGEKRGSWGEITGLELIPDADPAPAADPVPPVDAPVEGAPTSPFASPDAVVGGTLEVAPDTTPVVAPLPVEPEPTPDEAVDVAAQQANADAAPETALTTDDGTTPEPDPAHDTAVAEANDAIVQVALGTSDPDALAKALADVDAALAQYPDSAELADAKTQLTELTASAEPAAS